MTISFINSHELNVTVIQLLSVEYNIYLTGPKAKACLVGVLKDRSHFKHGLVEAIRSIFTMVYPMVAVSKQFN